MKEIRVKVGEDEQETTEFNLPVEEVAYALDVSTEELIDAIDEQQIGFRKITDQDDSVVIQVEAYARHCTVTVQAKR